MKKLVILVDMDGTIEDLLTVWLDRVNKRYGYDVKPCDLTSWDIDEAYPGLSMDQIKDILNDGSVWGEVKPIPYAAEVLQEFIADGHEVYIVSASNHETLHEKMHDLLFRYFPFLSWDNVIITTHKQLIKADVLIDDGIHNLIGGSYAKVLYDTTYNRNVDDEAHGFIRVHNWHEVKEVIDKMAEK